MLHKIEHEEDYNYKKGGADRKNIGSDQLSYACNMNSSGLVFHYVISNANTYNTKTITVTVDKKQQTETIITKAAAAASAVEPNYLSEWMDESIDLA